MGTQAGLTRVFNIDRKLTLTHPLKLVDMNSREITMSVDMWIKTFPKLLWIELYKGKFSLASDSYHSLNQVIKTRFPELHREKEAKKRARIAFKKAISQSHFS